MVHNTNDPKFERVPCNLCGIDNTKSVYYKFGIDISRCKHCGLCYVGPMRPRQEVIWQRYNPNYFGDEYLPAHGVVDNKYDPALHDALHAPLLRVLEPYKKLNAILDVGSGAGLFLKAAQRAGWRTVQGTEISEAAVEFSGEHFGLDVKLGKVEEVDLPESAFDAVGLVETVEHLLDPQGTLKRIHRLLRPGGALLVTTPNMNSISRRLLRVNWSVLSPLEHLYYFDERTLTAMLNKAGFANVRPVDAQLVTHGYAALNPYNSHAPQSLQSRIYAAFARMSSRLLWRQVVRYGYGDQLCLLAQKA